MCVTSITFCCTHFFMENQVEFLFQQQRSKKKKPNSLLEIECKYVKIIILAIYAIYTDTSFDVIYLKLLFVC